MSQVNAEATTIDASLTRDYQPYWAVRADALRRHGRLDEAQQAYARAIGLTEDDAVRRFLSARVKGF